MQYHNGATGVVVAINPDSDPQKESIVVRVDGDRIIASDTILLYRRSFPINDYLAEETSNSLKRIVAGEYQQFPIALGYAQTIHRSQGQTFEQMNLNPYSFAPGQLYTAISRVQSIQALHLEVKITPMMVKVCSAIHEYYEDIDKHNRRKYTESGQRVKAGRPTKNVAGTVKIHVPLPLYEHVKRECEARKKYKMRSIPKYGKGRIDIRVPAELTDHVKGEIQLWKEQVKKDNL